MATNVNGVRVPHKEYPIQKFAGLDNKNAPETLVTSDREGKLTAYETEAVNIDFSSTFKAMRRVGFSLHAAGSYHSLWFGDTYGFVVKDNRLVGIDSEMTMTDLAPASSRPFTYADTGAGIYLSDGLDVFRYLDTALVQLARVGTYSPSTSVLDPKEDPVIYDSPPAGSLFVWMLGRLWVATKEAVFFSRGYLPEQFNMADDFISEPGVTLLASVDDGFYIGTNSRVQFVRGLNPKHSNNVTTVSRYGAVSGTQIVLDDASRFGVEGAYGKGVVWESSDGKMLGLSGGRVVKMTTDHISYQAGTVGASLMRENNGDTYHVSSLRTGEGSNMRTTDVSTAEIRRNGVII